MKFSKMFMSLAELLLAALIVFVGIQVWNGYAQHSRIGVAVRDRDTITVDGMGKVTATPDLAMLSLGVQTDGASVKTAQTENTTKMNAIIAALKALDIKKEDITTEGYSISPKVDWNSGKQTIIGYTVSQNVSVKVRDLNKVGDVLAKAGELGANQVGGINFTIDEPKTLQAEARLKAIADARKKADELVGQLGLHIVKVVTFSEGGSYPPATPYYAKTMDMGMANEAAPAPTIEAGSQDVISNVSVTYEVY